MQMSQEQLEKLLASFYHNELESLVDNLEIDAESQSCYLKLKRQMEANEVENEFWACNKIERGGR